MKVVQELISYLDNCGLLTREQMTYLHEHGFYTRPLDLSEWYDNFFSDGDLSDNYEYQSPEEQEIEEEWDMLVAMERSHRTKYRRKARAKRSQKRWRASNYR